jgi:hypothetical protein
LSSYFFVVFENSTKPGANPRKNAAQSTAPLLRVGIFATGLGYVLNMQTLSAWVKNLLPEGRFGQFEGIRTLFVFVPLVTPIRRRKAAAKQSSFKRSFSWDKSIAESKNTRKKAFLRGFVPFRQYDVSKIFADKEIISREM